MHKDYVQNMAELTALAAERSRKNRLAALKVGDKVTRVLGHAVPMELTVSAITENEIVCNDWRFDRETGAEIDEFLGWDEFGSGSYLEV